MNGIPFSKDLLKGMHKELNEKGLFDDYEKWRLTKGWDCWGDEVESDIKLK